MVNNNTQKHNTDRDHDHGQGCLSEAANRFIKGLIVVTMVIGSIMLAGWLFEELDIFLGTIAGIAVVIAALYMIREMYEN